jgi:hypothetical protein
MLRVHLDPKLVLMAAVLMAGPFILPATALEPREETLSIPIEQTIALDEPAGESVGEPAAEDATVEGEPGPGDAADLPPDEPLGEEPAEGAGMVEPGGKKND